MTNVETSLSKPRRLWLAALLSLLGGGPLGQVYSGHFCRSMVLWIIAALLLPILLFVSISLPFSALGFFFLLVCVLGYPLFLAIDAVRLARRSRDAPLKRYQRWWVYVLLFVAFVVANNVLAHAAVAFIAEAFVVPSRAMSPTILAGDHFLADKLWSDENRLRRNDVVVFRSDGPESPLFVMRVAGLPGDEVQITDEVLFINGTEWDDRHASFEGPLLQHLDIANYGPEVIPSDSFFVLGDNRRRSNDSRFLGPIPFSDLYGTARVIYWSQTREFPNPDDTSHYELGRIRWDRIGKRLD